MWYNEYIIKERATDEKGLQGYKTMMVTNLINDNGRAVANQFVIMESDGTIAFQSYKSRVCEIRGKSMGYDNVVVLGKDWDYSRTTVKHLCDFLRQNGLAHLASAKDLREAIERGHARKDEAIAVWVDNTMR